VKRVLVVISVAFVVCGCLESVVWAGEGAVLQDWGPDMDYSIVVLGSQIPVEDVEKRSYLSYVTESADLLMKYGTDRYGPKHAPILVSIVDVRTRDCPKKPEPLDQRWRVQRPNRRNLASANMLMDQPILKMLFYLSDVTEDDKYEKFATGYMDYYMKNLVDEKGFFWWGWHRWYQVHEEIWGKIEFHPHEIHQIHSIAWDRLWKVNPKAVRNEIEAIWQRHVVDKKAGAVNRHNDQKTIADFGMAAAAYIQAFCFMYSETGESVWLDRAKVLGNYYWVSRNKETNCVPEFPCNVPLPPNRYAFYTTMVGLHSHALLKGWRLSGNDTFRDYAVAYLKAYAKYGYDESSGKFWGSVNLDGTPNRGPGPEGTYGRDIPQGHLDLWEPYVAGNQYGIYTAQTYAYAYQLTKEPIFLTTAKRFADWIAKELPVDHCREKSYYPGYARMFAPHGTYAGKYGRTISFFIQLYALTGEVKYLDLARKVAKESVSKLYYNGLFRGHPAKPYYEATDGVGFLLYALLELDQVLQRPSKAIGKDGIVVGGDEAETRIDFDNR
jgi:hypothetical protein